MTSSRNTNSSPQISVVLPVHNEGEYLAAVVHAYLEMLDRLGHEFELILVTNACTDDSVAIAASLERDHHSVVHLDLTAGGWGRAVRAGLSRARGQTVAYTNLARTSAQVLGLVLAYSVAYPDVVVKATRKVRDSWERRLGSLLYNLECRALFDIASWDVNGTPKAFPRSFDRLLQVQSDNDLIDAEFMMLCAQNGYPVIDVPIIYTRRHGGSSTTRVSSALRMYVGAIMLWRAKHASEPGR